MNVILIDTSTRVARVGLIQDQRLTQVREWESDRQVGERLLTTIDELLLQHHVSWEQIGRVAVHRGNAESSFMALRAGIVTATMLAAGKGVELVPIQGKTLEDMVMESCQGQGTLTIDPFYSSPKMPNSLDNS